MYFDRHYVILGPIRGEMTIARGHGIREIAQLRRDFGPGQWRKRKGVATVLIRATGEVFEAELHWYEATGIGKRRIKVKRRLR